MSALNLFQPPPLPGGKGGGLSRAQARNCALMNQLATPGLGSLMGGRWLAGCGQLALCLVGFGLMVFWFFRVMIGYYGMISDQMSEPKSYAAWGLAGAGVFALSWVWALFTSVSLWREAARNAEGQTKL